MRGKGREDAFTCFHSLRARVAARTSTYRLTLKAVETLRVWCIRSNCACLAYGFASRRLRGSLATVHALGHASLVAEHALSSRTRKKWDVNVNPFSRSRAGLHVARESDPSRGESNSRTAEHSLHAADPFSEAYEPRPHGTQADWPICGCACPKAHGSQAIEPERDVKLPAAQALQSRMPTISAKKPGMHSLHTVLPGSDWLVPSEHSLHLMARVVLLYLPASHGLQARPPVVSAYVPRSQATHTELPASGATVPGAHATHSRLPFVALMRPAVHG